MQTALKMETMPRAQGQVVITLEWIAYLAVAVMALVLRLAELDTVPLTHGEAREALAAWRAVTPSAAGDPIMASSALNFAAQSLAFATLGGNEIAARLGTVLAGVAVVLLPALFRDLLGVTRALIFSLLLLISPVLLASSRLGSPVVWSMLAAGLLIWAGWRFQATRQSGYGVGAALALTALIALTESGGLILALILAGAGILTALTDPEEDKDDEEETPQRETWTRSFPWIAAVGASALLVVIVGTSFLTYPAGLGAAGAALEGAVRGFFERTISLTMIPLLVAVFYEPFAALLGAAGLILMLRIGTLSAVERFLTAWVIMGVFASLVFIGAQPAHALWLTIPLTALASYTAYRCLVVTTQDLVFGIPLWARWVAALLMIGLLFLASIPFQDVARGLLQSFDLASLSADPVSVILLMLSLMFLVVGYFLLSSLWDGRTALRGAGLGLLIFGGITSLGAGWSISVTGAENPNQLWHSRVSSRDLFLLRSTLLEVAKREGRGFPERTPIYALVPSDGVIAWMLRDFKDTRFIRDLSEARTQPILLLPDYGTALDLGAPYVGQDFTVSRALSAQPLNPLDLPAWWSLGRSRAPVIRSEVVVLWLRQDVYQGVPFNEGLAG
jgi:hypothetical protein